MDWNNPCFIDLCIIRALEPRRLTSSHVIADLETKAGVPPWGRPLFYQRLRYLRECKVVFMDGDRLQGRPHTIIALAQTQHAKDIVQRIKLLNGCAVDDTPPAAISAPPPQRHLRLVQPKSTTAARSVSALSGSNLRRYNNLMATARDAGLESPLGQYWVRKAQEILQAPIDVSTSA